MPSKTRKHFKFPRKYSKSYCRKTSCKKMGFTQRSSCRPYKNCFQKGGDDQIQHCVSQLKRFADRAKEGKPFRTLQFGYNLGRLQEMIDGGKSNMNIYWWKPIEPLIEEQKWEELSKKVDEFREKTGKEYDEATIKKD